MLRPIRTLALLALALAACDSPTESVTPVPGDPAVQRQVWEQQGIDDYRYVLGRNCFCANLLPRVRVDVRDGVVVEVRDARTGAPVDARRWDGVATVDQVFDAIADGVARGWDTDVQFHPELGHPVAARIGDMSFDQGVSYSIEGLRRLD